MKRKIYLFFFAAIVLLTGCGKQFEPELCSVKVFGSHCTYKLEETSVPKYSFVKLQIFPERGYYVKDVSSNSYAEYAKVYKSKNEEDTYYIFISDDKHYISITMEQTSRYSIETYSYNYLCTITPDKERALDGDIVTFTVTPKNGYYYDLSDIKIKNSYSYDGDVNVSFTQSETNPNEFSFIMPKCGVEIRVDVKFGVTVSSQKESFNSDEKMIFDIENHTPDSTFDLQVWGYFAEETGSKLIASDIKLSNTYELPEDLFNDNDSGGFTLYVYPHGSDTSETSADFVVNLKNAPAGWTTLGIRERKYSSLPGMYLDFSNLPDNCSEIKVKYILENNDSSQKMEKSVTLPINYYNNVRFFIDEIETGIDLTIYNKLTVWVEDDIQKYISRKITVDLDFSDN